MEVKDDGDTLSREEDHAEGCARIHNFLADLGEGIARVQMISDPDKPEIKVRMTFMSPHDFVGDSNTYIPAQSIYIHGIDELVELREMLNHVIDHYNKETLSRHPIEGPPN